MNTHNASISVLERRMSRSMGLAAGCLSYRGSPVLRGSNAKLPKQAHTSNGGSRGTGYSTLFFNCPSHQSNGSTAYLDAARPDLAWRMQVIPPSLQMFRKCTDDSCKGNEELSARRLPRPMPLK